MTNTTKTYPDVSEPLERYRIVGMRENWVGVNAGTPVARKVPGGSCWHCGTGIAIEVVIRHTDTGEEHTIGTTCAERVGLDRAELKRLLAERFADERRERSAAYRREAAEWMDAVDAELTETVGPHGSPARYLDGCQCDACLDGAPHGTDAKFRQGECTCPTCLDFALATYPDNGDPGGFGIADFDVLVNLGTGSVIDDARRVNTRYGMRWAPTSMNDWAPVEPARRSTMAKRGLTEAEAPFLYRRSRDDYGTCRRPVARLGDPIVDNWGERITREGTR